MATIEARYRYRLRVTDREALLLKEVFDSCRFVWNQALGRWGQSWSDQKVALNSSAAYKELTAWRARLDWLGAQPSVPQQQIIRDLYASISAFFTKSNPSGRPRFKKRRDDYASARWTKNGFAVDGTGLGKPGDRLCVATSAGRIALCMVWSRPLPSVPTSVTIRRNAQGHYYASFVVRIAVPEGPLHPGEQSTGLDVGLTTFATTEGEATDIENPRYAKCAAKALARSQRNMASKKKGSKNGEKARRRVARVSAKVAHQRADFHHKAARALIGSYARIGLEDLAVKNMSRRGNGRTKKGLNRAIADAGWSQFRAILIWQAHKAGTQVVVLPPNDTTQRCSCCGEKANPRIELSDRIFTCRVCGLVLGRDRNSARNLNPGRIGTSAGGSKPVGVAVPEGDDGKKSKVSAETSAA